MFAVAHPVNRSAEDTSRNRRHIRTATAATLFLFGD
jgi:hypothetical protein